MKRIAFFITTGIILLSKNPVAAQSAVNRFLSPSDSLDCARVALVAGSWTTIYAGTVIALNQTWYADYPHTSFHFFNDNGEWLQMDKAGHLYTSYFESVWTMNAFHWAGVDEKKSAWLGGATGFLMQSTIEILDGFSEKWGASSGDIAANGIGAALCISQQLLWNEQRIMLKFSTHQVSYEQDLSQRVNSLFGNSSVERALKDYNGQTYWLSLNPSSFIRKEHGILPRWLNFSVGYGAEGMLGGFENSWEENGEVINYGTVERVRQFYLSPDIDFNRIKTNSVALKTVFSVLNIIKVPAPALEVNSKGKMKFYPLYF